MAQFQLREEHIRLVKDLCFKSEIKTYYGDTIIPTINKKRPFGNSGATYDVMGKLGYLDGSGEYTPEDKKKTELLLAELPVALEIILTEQTFTPGNYEVDEYGAYYYYKMVINFLYLKPALAECKETVKGFEQYEQQLYELCCSITKSDSPFNYVITFLQDINMSVDVADKSIIDRLIQIFNKYKEQKSCKS